MQMQAVKKSSQIEAIGYDADTKTLAVQFKGGSIYNYQNVPQETFTALQQAESVGQYFATNIRKMFEFEKQEAAE